MIKLVADTNVWYRAVNDDSLELKNLKKIKRKIYIAPISILEITKGIDSSNFHYKKEIAKTIINYADGILDELPLHLAKIWDLQLKGYSFDWKNDALKHISEAPNYRALIDGYPSYSEGKIKKIHFSKFDELNKAHWKGWEKDTISALESRCPGYEIARSLGKTKFLKRNDLNRIEKELKSNRMEYMFLWAALTLSKQAVKKCNRFSENKFNREKLRVKKTLQPFIDAYIEYFIRCLGNFTPQANDYVDLFLFFYLQNNYRLLSYDDRWVRIAKKVCPNFLYQ